MRTSDRDDHPAVDAWGLQESSKQEMHSLHRSGCATLTRELHADDELSDHETPGQ